MGRNYAILAIDGGGIRGVIPARVITELEAQLGAPAHTFFDMIAGTSTGGIIALGLAKPASHGSPALSAADLLQLYVSEGSTIFPRSFLPWVRELFNERYPTQPLESLMKRKFGATMLSEAMTEVVIPSYDLSRPGPFFFKRKYPLEDPSLDVPMWTVARATSAAPTYFEPAALPRLGTGDSDHALVDGGVFANNPAVAAYADAVEECDQDAQDAEIHVISIGTGAPKPTAQGGGEIPVSYAKARNWGLIKWARPILEVELDGVAKAVDWQMRRLCHTTSGLRYHRLQTTLVTASHAMDDASDENIAALQHDAEAMLTAKAGEIRDICDMLKAMKGKPVAPTP